MAKDHIEKEFKDYVERQHSNGDLRILKEFITALRDECKYRRYDPKVIACVQSLTSASAEEFAYDNLLDIIAINLGK